MSEEDFECSCCRDYFPIVDVKYCTICNFEVCEECKEERDVINLEEWLIDCPNKCNKCKRVGCGECITTCYQCWNIGEEALFLCIDCSDFTKQDCEYHNWELCTRHSNNKCVVCVANKNYSGKNSF